MVGKRVLGRTYVHTLLFDELPEENQHQIRQAARIAGLRPNEHFHVARLNPDQDEVALLGYPTFFGELFPSLLASWRVHLPTESVHFRDYSSSLNPPILHRKELMLPSGHPERPRLEQITRLAESIGLFADSTRIGFLLQWNELVASKGYMIAGQDLLPASNVSDADIAASRMDLADRSPVLRHLTALSRTFLSAPVQALLRHQLLTPASTFLDYGCGKGNDIDGIQSLGISASGWDPYFRPEGYRLPADVVNIGFVVNVIENLDERIEALERAFELTRGVLSVAAMLSTNNGSRGLPFGDGYLTSRNTFQKYFSQGELQNFIESVLDEQAVPVGPGIFFVFRDRHLEQHYLSRRHSDASRAPRLLAKRQVLPRAMQTRRQARVKEQNPALREEADSIWGLSLELGRLPDKEEYPRATEATELFGTWRRALRAATAKKDHSLLEQAGSERSDEIRAFFAMQAFARRKPLKEFEPRLRRDIKSLFGSLGVAEMEGRRLLLQCGDINAISAACQRAASLGLGWLDPEQSLQLHSSLVTRLDPILRVYLGCATVLYGDVLSADLVKIHIQSGKVTLMKFDDFAGSPLPRMIERVKVSLREQDLDRYEYTGEYTPSYLYHKSRYINEEFPRYPEQLEFDRQLESLGLPMATEYGPEPAEFQRWLQASRREICGMSLVPSTRIPDLDEPCGESFTFRHLIECGETWERIRIDNVPCNADTYNALHALSTTVLDPVIEYFGAIRITYGFASRELTRRIDTRIAPDLDQHAACEVDRKGRPVCSRQGAAVDFIVEYEDMLEVARWIAANCAFSRMYVYGTDRPLHVSVDEENAGEIYEMRVHGKRRVPRRLRF